MTGWALRTVRIGRSTELVGWEACATRLMRPVPDDGRRLWLLNPPSVRRWSSTGTLLSDVPTGWDLRGNRLSAADESAEADLVELGGAEAAAMAADRSAATTVLGSFAPLTGPASLGRFVVAGRVLDTNVFGGRRVNSEQTALGLYRVLRLRRSPFWDGAARHVMNEVVRRVESAGPGIGPVHDLWGRGETHARFLTDAWLLLLAGVEEGPADERIAAAADAAATMVEALGVRCGAGRWYLHDSLELAAGINERVLNTHAQVVAAQLVAGLPTAASTAALDAALQMPRLTGAAVRAALGLAVADAVRAGLPARWSDRAEALGRAAHRSASRHRRQNRYLRGPLGHIARDNSETVAPSYYLTVNLYDLGVLAANADLPRVRRAFTAGVRYARHSGYFRAQLRDGHALAALVPIVLAQAGLPRAAERAAASARSAGVAPTPGWPGYEDRPWRRLRKGTV